MGYLANVSLSFYSGICHGSKYECGGSSGLGQKIFGCGFDGSGVVMLGYKRDNSKGVDFKAYSGKKSVRAHECESST